ncbi:hypothetical protein RYX36_011336 [Vicia faba]
MSKENWGIVFFSDSFSVLSKSIQQTTASRDSSFIVTAFELRTEATVMGIIRRFFTFIAGNVVGIYVAQNYQVPNIKKEADTFLLTAKEFEEKYRKPNKKGGNDGV